MNIHDEFLAVVNALERANIQYAVCGGLAVALHGFPRHTKDIDIIIQETDLEVVKQVVAIIGFDIESGLIRFKTGQPNEERVFRVVKIEGTEYLMLDLILVTPALNAIWSDRERFLLGEQQVTVVSKQGLISMKRLAGRPIDLLDVSHLEGKPQE